MYANDTSPSKSGREYERGGEADKNLRIAKPLLEGLDVLTGGTVTIVKQLSYCYETLGLLLSKTDRRAHRHRVQSRNVLFWRSTLLSDRPAIGVIMCRRLVRTYRLPRAGCQCDNHQRSDKD